MNDALALTLHLLPPRIAILVPPKNDRGVDPKIVRRARLGAIGISHCCSRDRRHPRIP